MIPEINELPVASLDPVELRNWISSQDPGSTIGYAGRAATCPWDTITSRANRRWIYSTSQQTR